jgi:hypothetical protein
MMSMFIISDRSEIGSIGIDQAIWVALTSKEVADSSLKFLQDEHILPKIFYIHTYLSLVLYPRSGSKDISDIPPIRPRFSRMT